MMSSMAIQSVSVCSPEHGLANQLGITINPLDISCIPASIRRRSSLPTRLAISAAMTACEQAGIKASETPSLFASVGGEMLITDQLCLELTKPVVHISPTQFHNSVHNTAAAYWSIITGCQQASTAMAAGDHTIAMVIIEAWSWLVTNGGKLLLVCYEESWPDYIDPGNGYHSIGYAMVLSAESDDKTIAHCSCPYVSDQPLQITSGLKKLIMCDPLLALTHLFQAIAKPGDVKVAPLSLDSRYWAVDVQVASSHISAR
ncbi:MAG TPA: hypothetical protein ENJ32_12835 [Crenotrichaceae bacterium]|nr:hypothetical protein [Crenotrichaceae bacterium]